MPRIAALTMNPTIDVSYDIEEMRHTRKMRTSNEIYAPGGGGINVARVIRRLGTDALNFYLSGGVTGATLAGLLAEHGLACCPIPIAGPVRIAAAVHELSTGKEYRFTPAGPNVTEAEAEACLARLAQAEAQGLSALVLSGSLPPGVPADFYARAAAQAGASGVPVALDTSGPALAASVAAGGLWIIKPSQGELEQLAGRKLATISAIGEAAAQIVAAGKVRLVTVTMGHRGALLARAEGVLHLPAPDVEAKSAVGAGDSFLAGMIHALLSGRDEEDAFRYGLAAGSAAVLTPGNNLALPEDIERLYAEIAAVPG